MNITTVKELKDFIENLPDDMVVSSCCSSGDGLGIEINESWSWEEEKAYNYVWIGYQE